MWALMSAQQVLLCYQEEACQPRRVGVHGLPAADGRTASRPLLPSGESHSYVSPFSSFVCGSCCNPYRKSSLHLH